MNEPSSTAQQLGNILVGSTSMEQLLANEEALTEAELAKLRQAVEERQVPKITFKKLQPKKVLGISSIDWEVMWRHMQGMTPIVIAQETGYTVARIRGIVKSPNNAAILQALRADAQECLQNLVIGATESLRELLNNSDPKIRLGAVREIAKINGLYQDDRKVNSAEDLVANVLSLARESLQVANRPERRESVTRLIEGTSVDD